MSKKLLQPKRCPECKKLGSWFAGDICNNCYRQNHWKREKKICSNCKRLLPLKAKGLCSGCYNTVFKLDYHKAMNYKKWYNLDIESYKKITKMCVVCGFDKFVALHHLDQDKHNNSTDNFVGLCPNHHQMLHSLKFKDEMFQILKEKGYSPKEKKLRTNIAGGY